MTTFWEWLKGGLTNIDFDFWKFISLVLSGAIIISLSIGAMLSLDYFLIILGVLGLNSGILVILYAYYKADN